MSVTTADVAIIGGERRDPRQLSLRSPMVGLRRERGKKEWVVVGLEKEERIFPLFFLPSLPFYLLSLLSLYIG